ncbi:amidohydrolase family protein, partial [Franconibacter helveticus]
MATTWTTAIRGHFFDISDVADSAEEIAQRARSLEDGLLFLDGGRIVSLVPWEEGCAQLRHENDYQDYRGKLIVPGFVDSHIHYPQTEMIGAYGEQLLTWLENYTFPVEGQYHSPDHAARMSAFFLNQLLANGTTTALVFGT